MEIKDTHPYNCVKKREREYTQNKKKPMIAHAINCTNSMKMGEIHFTNTTSLQF